MHRLKHSFLGRAVLFLILAAAAFAQTESQIESDEVKRVGTHIGCQCGACQENVNCNMSSGQCHFCKPARTKIYRMQKAGVDDTGIIDEFKKLYGAGVYRADPNSFFLDWFRISRSRVAACSCFSLSAGSPPSPAPVAAAEDPAFARYREAIEKDTEKLD